MADRMVAIEALTGAHAGRLLSCEIIATERWSPGPVCLWLFQRQHTRFRASCSSPRRAHGPEHRFCTDGAAETLLTCGYSSPVRQGLQATSW